MSKDTLYCYKGKEFESEHDAMMLWFMDHYQKTIEEVIRLNYGKNLFKSFDIDFDFEKPIGKIKQFPDFMATVKCYFNATKTRYMIIKIVCEIKPDIEGFGKTFGNVLNQINYYRALANFGPTRDGFIGIIITMNQKFDHWKDQADVVFVYPSTNEITQKQKP